MWTKAAQRLPVPVNREEAALVNKTKVVNILNGAVQRIHE
jgi:hypothetical protein